MTKIYLGNDTYEYHFDDNVTVLKLTNNQIEELLGDNSLVCEIQENCDELDVENGYLKEELDGVKTELSVAIQDIDTSHQKCREAENKSEKIFDTVRKARKILGEIDAI